jgi:hypothetical protein
MIRKLSLLFAAAVCIQSVPTLATSLQEVVKETVGFKSCCSPSGPDLVQVTSAVYTDGTDYIYAYQIFDATSDFSWFSVGLLNNPAISNVQVGDLGFLTPEGSLAPMAWEVSGASDSVDAMFIPNKIGPGETSQWLTFISNWGPGDGVAVLANLSGTTTSCASGHVYTPMIPEPMTLLLLGAGALALRKRRAN